MVVYVLLVPLFIVPVLFGIGYHLEWLVGDAGSNTAFNFTHWYKEIVVSSSYTSSL